MAWGGGAAVGEGRLAAGAEGKSRPRPARVRVLGMERARAMVGGMEAGQVARRLRAGAGGGMGAAAKGTRGAARAAGRSPSAAAAPAARRRVVVGRLEAERLVVGVTMPVAAAMSARAGETRAMARAAGRLEAGCLPAEGMSLGAASGRRWRRAAPRRRRSRGSLAGAARAVAAAGRAARRTPTWPAVAA